MPKPFIERLRDYYTDVGKVLRGEANVASVFPNPSDIGLSREQAYAEFLRQHAPSKCNVEFGGFLFDEDGAESKQLDIIITTDTAPRFDFAKREGGKVFSPVEGTLGVISVKSTLDRKNLFEALDNLASIPPTKPLGNRVNPLAKIPNYDDWPVKVIYANDGVSGETLLQHIDEFYGSRPEIPVTRKPNFIHVIGKYLFARATPGVSVRNMKTGRDKDLTIGNFYGISADVDLSGLAWVVNALQQNATASNHINFRYAEIFNKALGVAPLTG